MESTKSNNELLHEIALLRKELAFYKAFADFSYDLESIHTHNGSISYISPSYEKICGYSVAEFTENPNLLIDIALPEYKDFLNFHLHNDLHKEPGHFEFQIKTKTGEILWLEHRCQPCFTATGELIGYRASNRDITKRKKSEEQLQESLNRNKALLDAIPDLIFVFDSNYRIIDYNAENDKSSLYTTPSVFLNNYIDHVLPPELVKITKQSIDEVLTGGVPIATTYELTINNLLQQFEARYALCGNNEVLAIVRNITKAIQSEKTKVRESELRHLLVQISTDYINLPSSKIEETINDSLERLAKFVGADRAYIFSFDAKTELSTNTHEWCNNEIISLKNQFQSVHLPNEFIAIHKKGGTVRIENVDNLPLSANKLWLQNQNIKSLLVVSLMLNNECIGFVGFDSVKEFYAYTEIEEQILQVFAEMLVNIQIRKTTEKELIEAKEHAEESDRLKSSFLENLSHEIRTPMHAICGFVDFLNDRDLPEEKQRNYTRIIHNSANHLLSIVSDILTISSLETKQEKIKLGRANVNSILLEELENYKANAQNTTVSFYIKQQLTDRKAEIKTDASKLKQIIKNLVSNAFKFTHEGSVELGYKKVRSAETEYLEFYVKDTGIGISPDFQPKVFDRFRKADQSASSQYAGTGLGLAICKGFAELLGGKIWFSSEQEKGSTFYFSIPYVPYFEDSIPTNSSEISIKTVVIAEDEEYNYLFLEELLNQLGVNIFHAKSGNEVIEICNTLTDINLILMDIKMPGIDGYEAALQIKAKQPHIPIIAQSAYALDKEIRQYKDVFDAYVTKPIDINLLLPLINKYL